MDDSQRTQHHLSASSRCPCHPVHRRAHKKSRNGCRTCKRRRIKCDETKPLCKNCTRCDIPCDFTAIDVAPSPARGTALEVAYIPRKRGRPLKWTESPQRPGNDFAGLTVIASPPYLAVEPSNSLFPRLNVDELELFYHYLKHTSITLGDDVLWRDKVPRLAFENHFILRLMLALSALHLARLRPNKADSYEDLAERYFPIALHELTALLPHVDRENCSALYIGTVLVCNYAFAKPPKRGHLLLVAEGPEVAWWNLFRGVRFVIETMGIPAIFAGHLSPIHSETTRKTPPIEDEERFLPWEQPLAELKGLISACDSPVHRIFMSMHEALEDIFREVYGTTEQPENSTQGKMHIVMRWLWFLDDESINQVRIRSPLALIITAHFAVLLQTLESFWFMRGWAHHVISDIVILLDSEQVRFISWPMQQIGWHSRNALLCIS